MSIKAQENCKPENLKKLKEFLSHNKDVREWKRGEAVRLRLEGFSYREIQARLGVSINFIARNQRKFLEQVIEGLRLRHQDSKSYLKESEKEEIMAWLKEPQNRNLSELERQIIENYDVVFKSRESYYQLLKRSRLSWQKGNRENPRKKPELIQAKNEEIAKILEELEPDIEEEKLVAYALDECHLQGDDICGYLWGDKKDRQIVKIENERDRQTYYGALNLISKEFIVCPYSGGNGKNTAKFIEHLKAAHPHSKILLIWDGASYHRGEEMQKLSHQYNEGKEPKDWLITCHLFAPYVPKENPVEAVWLQAKNFIRRFYYLGKNFAIVKRLFQFFFKFQLFNPPNLKKYDAFAQMI